MVNNPPTNAGDTDLIPGLEGSPGERNRNSCQYSCLDMTMDSNGYIPWGHKEQHTTEWPSTRAVSVGDDGK